MCPCGWAVPMTRGPVLIVGAGHAGFQLASSLRQHGFAEPIGLINDEAHLPYQPAPLSKAYLKGGGGGRRRRYPDVPARQILSRAERRVDRRSRRRDRSGPAPAAAGIRRIATVRA